MRFIVLAAAVAALVLVDFFKVESETTLLTLT